jgi:uncharacterized protein
VTRRGGSVAAATVAGVLFGAGLLISGMAQPRKVIGFLDVFGAWDASLAFVMLGAVAVHAVGYRLVTRRSRPLFAAEFAVPGRARLDLKLVGGATLFGVGWGLSGYCPGPSVVALPSAQPGVLAFVAALLCGMLATAKLEAALSARRQPGARATPLVADIGRDEHGLRP